MLAALTANEKHESSCLELEVEGQAVELWSLPCPPLLVTCPDNHRLHSPYSLYGWLRILWTLDGKNSEVKVRFAGTGVTWESRHLFPNNLRLGTGTNTFIRTESFLDSKLCAGQVHYPWSLRVHKFPFWFMTWSKNILLMFHILVFYTFELNEDERDYEN